jgi:phosphate-selective porin OprO and OprP
VRNILGYGAELVGVYGPLSVQAEYLGAHYNRDAGAVLEASTLGYYAPGGSLLNFDGYFALWNLKVNYIK